MSFPAITVAPEGSLGQLERTVALLAQADARVRRRFLALVDSARTVSTLENLATLIERGRINEALAVSQDIAPGIATALEASYVAAGLSAGVVLRSKVDSDLDFNSLNRRAVADMSLTRVRLIREFTAEQRRATQVFLQDAFSRGLAPVAQARELRKSIGLTQRQSQAVANFRRMLTEGSNQSLSQALTRKLRDRRFDPSIQAALSGRRRLTAPQIERMTDRYRERFVQFRARTIANTESLQATGQGEEEMFLQAIEAGVLVPDAVAKRWVDRDDSKVRESHRFMVVREVATMDGLFVTGDGNRARFPGDPALPASDKINCRCRVVREIDQSQLPGTRRAVPPLRVAA